MRIRMRGKHIGLAIMAVLFIASVIAVFQELTP